MTRVLCGFCAHACSLTEGQTGLCGVRKNIEGSIVSLSWGRIVSKAADPIEKKPLYHVLPGSQTLSFALEGCNFTCAFCQNWEISQIHGTSRGQTRVRDLDEVARLIEHSTCPTVAFTYSEPTVWMDWVIEVSAIARRLNRKCLFVSNGFVSSAGLEALVPHIDAWNIDLKGDDDFYRRYCGGRLGPVLDTIAFLAENSWLEVSSLLIESIHDEAFVETAGRQLTERGVRVWHLSGFVPRYKMTTTAASSPDYLSRMTQRATGTIPFVYGPFSRDTLCPQCGTVLIRRSGWSTTVNLRDGGVCTSCSSALAGIFEA